MIAAARSISGCGGGLASAYRAMIAVAVFYLATGAAIGGWK